MKIKPGFSLLLEASSISLGLLIFSFFIHYSFPVRFMSFAALLLAGVLISRNLKSLSDLKKIFGEKYDVNITVYILSGVLAGLVLGVIYRWYVGLSFIPKSLFLFAIVSALIGSTEELVFRGFLQDMVRKVNGPFSIIFSSFSHTGYKCFLFMSPAVSENIRMEYLFFWTLGFGLVFGTVRHYSKSIWAPLVAHAVFDIVVYGGLSQAPWWVW